MICIGIDPGERGGIALIGDGPNVIVRTVFAMPLMPYTKTKQQVDVEAILAKIDWCIHSIDLVVIEQVHSMPKQGVSSTFSFAKNYGTIIGCVQTLRLKYALVTPQKWKAKILENTLKDKNAAIEYAQKKYPDISLLANKRCRVPSDGLADAICLCDYAFSLLEESS